MDEKEKYTLGFLAWMLDVKELMIKTLFFILVQNFSWMLPGSAFSNYFTSGIHARKPSVYFSFSSIMSSVVADDRRFSLNNQVSRQLSYKQVSLDTLQYKSKSVSSETNVEIKSISIMYITIKYIKIWWHISRILKYLSCKKNVLPRLPYFLSSNICLRSMSYIPYLMDVEPWTSIPLRRCQIPSEHRDTA